MRIPGLLAALLIILSLGVDLYIYFDLKRNFRSAVWAPRIYLISSILCWIFMGICLAYPRRDADHGILFLMWALYSYLTLYLPKCIFTLLSLLGSLPKIWKAPALQLGKWIGLPLGALTFIALWWGALVTRHEIEVTQVQVNSPKLPEAFDNYRIIQISDLHVGTWGDDTRFISRLVDSVNSRKPDLVVFTGDIVNRRTDELAPFLKILSGIRARDGVWSVLGNHDYGDYIEWDSAAEKKANLELLKNWQRQIGWNMLNNRGAEIVNAGDTIQLIGVENWGEPPFRQYGHIMEAYPLDSANVKHLHDSNFKILLSHNPEHWRREITDISNIDLTLSGHTHAMQTELRFAGRKWSPCVWRYPQWGGLYAKTNPEGEILQLYVNIGAGEVGLPFRIGAIPEITELTLRKAPVDYSLNLNKL